MALDAESRALVVAVLLLLYRNSVAACRSIPTLDFKNSFACSHTLQR